MDLTFSPRWTTQQGVLGDVEWRHRLSSGIYSTQVWGIYELQSNDNEEVSCQHRKSRERERGGCSKHLDGYCDC